MIFQHEFIQLIHLRENGHGLQGIFQCQKKMRVINALCCFGQVVPYVHSVAMISRKKL